ncbi:hypothetical protein CDAR_87561 [Caerostris darwini]|uniref:Uncharacterized protein n=1 Tax=Caerostris darwini TaxID=1538125 RepID=A0AAV4WZR6_9ARAC|nr:hypothetical protein CDAR_87561 [Caerostris darwini]
MKILRVKPQILNSGFEEINIIFPDAKHGAFIGSAESLTLCSSLNLTPIECLPGGEKQRMPVFLDSRSPFGQTFSGYCAIQPMASYWRWRRRRYLRCLSNVGAPFLLLMMEPYKRETIPKGISLDCSGGVFTQSSVHEKEDPGLQVLF